MESNLIGKNINVLVVDDHPIYRKGICDIISDMPLIFKCYEAENGNIALQILESKVINIVILDIEMPDMKGTEVFKFIKLKYPYIKVLILTMTHSYSHIVESVENGVNGYLFKSTDAKELVRAFQLIIEGNIYFCPEAMNSWSKYLVNNAKYEKQESKNEILTKRQKQIIFHLCHQQTTKEISNILYISEATVNNHKAQIMKRLNIKNGIGLALYAVKSGIYPI